MVGNEGRYVWRHVREAQGLRGEDQIPRYVADLELDECVAILAASPVGLPSLARLRDECRVTREETRGFEEVIRTWTVEVLSGMEGG